ncbi:MAG TPA: nuclear transport factor 2 family protein [Acidimicrobiales bacterium]|nr:nuclear transport factor 2 family protein [Acidimicrobiales bacterium]
MTGPQVPAAGPPGAPFDASAAVRELADRAALGDLVRAYASGCDRRDPAAVTATFTEDGRLAKCADPSGTGPATVEWRGRPAIAGVIAGLDRYAVTTHFLGQQAVAVDGDRATGETYCMAHHHYVHDGAWFDRVMAIRYFDHYRRAGGRWLIEDRRLVVDWVAYRPVGDPAMAPPWSVEQDAASRRPIP